LKFRIAINGKKFPDSNLPKMEINFQHIKIFILGGCHILSPFSKTLSLVFFPFLEQDWMRFLQISLQFPSGLLRTKVLPLHLYLSDGSIPECYLSLIQNVQGFHLELTLRFYLHEVPINHMSRVMNILF
jgi:hypothetical protein